MEYVWSQHGMYAFHGFHVKWGLFHIDFTWNGAYSHHPVSETPNWYSWLWQLSIASLRKLRCAIVLGNPFLYNSNFFSIWCYQLSKGSEDQSKFFLSAKNLSVRRSQNCCNLAVIIHQNMWHDVSHSPLHILLSYILIDTWSKSSNKPVIVCIWMLFGMNIKKQL